MAYTNAQAQQQLLDSLGAAADEMALALAYLGVAYEQLDESSADRLEAELFRPLQLAYGQAQRSHSEFARRHGLPIREFAEGHPQVREHNARAIIEAAASAVARADATLGTLQDSLLPVEVGDPELRAGLEAVRQRLAHTGTRTRDVLRTLGR